MAKHSGSPRPRRGLKIIILLCALIFLGSAAGCSLALYDYLVAANDYYALKHLYVPARAQAQPPQAGAETDAGIITGEGQDESPPPPVTAVDFAALQAINADICAWLALDNTRLSYPVLRGSDNSYYLNHLYNGRENKAGSLFVDYRNSAGFIDRNTVIYGHNMRDRSMFWPLSQYKSQSYYDQHPQMRLLTPEGDYTLQLFAGCLVDAQSSAWQREFVDDRAFLDWLEQMRANSSFVSAVEVNAEDRVVALSTCVYDFPDARYVLFGKLAAAE